MNGTEKLTHRMLEAEKALFMLTDRNHSRSREISVICGEARAVLQLYVLDWAADRSQRGEDEANPLIAYGMGPEYLFFMETLGAMEAGQEQITSTDFKRAVNIYWALTVARSWESIHKGLEEVENLA